MKRSPLAVAISLAILPTFVSAQVLEEVIVTAQKKEETLTESPVAVSVVSGQTIDDLSIFQADELNKLVTGMEVRFEGDSLGRCWPAWRWHLPAAERAGPCRYLHGRLLHVVPGRVCPGQYVRYGQCTDPQGSAGAPCTVNPHRQAP